MCEDEDDTSAPRVLQHHQFLSAIGHVCGLHCSRGEECHFGLAPTVKSNIRNDGFSPVLSHGVLRYVHRTPERYLSYCVPSQQGAD